MTTHTDLIALLRDHFCDMSESDYMRAADALEAQDTTITALCAEIAALTEYNKTRTDELIAAGKQVAALTKERDDYRTGYYAQNETRAKFQQELNACEEHLAAAQAREAKLLEALELAMPAIGYGYDAARCTAAFETVHTAQAAAVQALALPTDDSALMERLKQEYERGYADATREGVA